jgi:hypothetical protein
MGSENEALSTLLGGWLRPGGGPAGGRGRLEVMQSGSNPGRPGAADSQ